MQICQLKPSGAKNAALPVLVSSLLVDGESTFRNIPDLADIKTIKKLLRSLGVTSRTQAVLAVGLMSDLSEGSLS